METQELGITGTEKGAGLDFGVVLLPDTSTNVSAYLDLGLDDPIIHRSFPATCKSKDDIIDMIRSKLANAQSSANGAVRDALAAKLNIGDFFQPFMDRTTVQFTKIDIGVPLLVPAHSHNPGRKTNHTWSLSDVGDTTTVITANLVFGYPHAF